MSVKERLVEFINSCSLNKSQFEKRVGLSNGYINNIKQSISKDKLELISNKFPNLNLSWLIFGEGEMLKGGLYEKYNPKNNAIDRGALEGDFEKFITKSGTEYSVVSEGNLRLTVKYVEHKAQAGYLSGWADPDYIDTLPTTIITVKRIHFGDYRVFEVSGDSMDYEGKRAIEEGDSVIGRKVERDFWTESRLHIHEWKEWVIVHDEGIIIKHITSHDVEAGIITCRSYNVDKTIYPDFDLSLERVYEIYNVVKIEKNR